MSCRSSRFSTSVSNRLLALLGVAILAAGVGTPAQAGPIGAVGDLYVVDSWHNVVVQFDGTTGARVGTFASGGLTRAGNLVFGADGDLYVSNTRPNNTDGINPYDGNTGAFLGEFVPLGTAGLDGAGKMAFGPNGNLFVAAYSEVSSSGGVYEFDGTTGAFVRMIGAGHFFQTLAFLPSGNLIALDHLTGNVWEYAMPAGTLVGLYAIVPTAQAGMGIAESMIFAANGNLFVLSAHQIHQLDAAGTIVSSFPLTETNFPSDIALGPDGMLYVSDFNFGEVHRYNPVTGAYLGIFADGLIYPIGLTFKGVIPEPATLVLLVVGALGLARRRR